MKVHISFSNVNYKEFLTLPTEFNQSIPENLYLFAGDNAIEILADPMRDSASVAMPKDAWKKVILWTRDLVSEVVKCDDQSIFIIDLNPSFAMYTQNGIAAADYLVVPFTADDSSRRGIENMAALIYGYTKDERLKEFSKIDFAGKSREFDVNLTQICFFVSNRVTFYKKKPSKAFEAAQNKIESLIEDYKTFKSGVKIENGDIIQIPDYHSACVIMALTGAPLSKLKPGPHRVGGKQVQLNKGLLDNYRNENKSSGRKNRIYYLV